MAESVTDARLYEQCCTVYNAMLRNSQPSADPDVRVYRGYTTYLLEQQGLSISIYTPVMRRLRSMGCVQQVVRGGRGTPSEWQVLKPPNRQAFARGGQRWIAQGERIAELEERVSVLESSLEELRESVA